MWLNKIETFQAVKSKLKTSKIRFIQFDPLRDKISGLFDVSQPSAFYVSLLNRSNSFQWLFQKELWKEAYVKEKGFLFVMTASGEMTLFDATTTPYKNKKGKASLPFATLQKALDAFDLDIREGHIKGEEVTFFNDFLQNHLEVKKILEIGFNAGHSSELFLSNRQDTKVLSFDIMDHDYGYVGKDYIDFSFQNRHQLIIGDSQDTVPHFSKNNPNEHFDLIFIDGGHEESCAAADILNCRMLARKDTWVIIDDIDSIEDGKMIEWSVGPTNAWNQAIEKGIIKEIDRKHFGLRGWAIGKYVFD